MNATPWLADENQGHLVPVAGRTPGTPARFMRSGYVADGKTHFTLAPYGVNGGDTVRTVCNRVIVTSTIYRADAFPSLLARPHATHETGVCRDCVRRVAQ